MFVFKLLCNVINIVALPFTKTEHKVWKIFEMKEKELNTKINMNNLSATLLDNINSMEYQINSVS